MTTEKGSVRVAWVGVGGKKINRYICVRVIQIPQDAAASLSLSAKSWERFSHLHWLSPDFIRGNPSFPDEHPMDASRATPLHGGYVPRTSPKARHAGSLRQGDPMDHDTEIQCLSDTWRSNKTPPDTMSKQVSQFRIAATKHHGTGSLYTPVIRDQAAVAKRHGAPLFRSLSTQLPDEPNIQLPYSTKSKVTMVKKYPHVAPICICVAISCELPTY